MQKISFLPSRQINLDSTIAFAYSKLVMIVFLPYRNVTWSTYTWYEFLRKAEFLNASKTRLVRCIVVSLSTTIDNDHYWQERDLKTNTKGEKLDTINIENVWRLQRKQTQAT